MPSDLDIEILTIDDSAPLVKTTLNKTKNPLKKKWRTMRKSTGVGGKAPHSAIPFKPLRKTVAVQPPSPKKAKNVDPEYFDVEDDEDSDDEIQVIENDPLNYVEVISDGASDGFCDICGLFLDNAKDMENHHGTVHQLVTCKWCQIRLGISEVKNHIGSKLCPNFTKLLGSHCSVHNEIETDEKLEKEEFKNCRPLRCDACSQRYDRKSLRDFDEQSKSYICPGCLHGRIESPESDEKEVLTDNEKHDEIEPVVITTSPKIVRPVPEFLSTPNPIPLPEILLLDDFDQDHRADDALEQELSNAATGKKEESVIPSNKNGNKSKLVKKKEESLTSKLVELINTELQEKPIADINVESMEEFKDVGNSVSRSSNDGEEEKLIDLDENEIICEEIESPTTESNMEVTVVECPREDESNKQEEESPIDNNAVRSKDLSVDGLIINPSTEEEDSCSVIEIIENSEVVASVTKLVGNDESKHKNEVDEILVENNSCETRIADDSIPTASFPTRTSPTKCTTAELVSTEIQSPSITTPARRVARKSTKPPQKPQRITENLSELLLFENLNATPSSTLSPKRKLASPTTSRKVARKSTRPPNNPQRTLFSEDRVEIEKTNLTSPDLDNDAMDCALLLATPEKTKDEAVVELEVLDEIVG